MRLQFRGYYSVDAIKKAFNEVLDTLLENDVDGLANLNMYFRPHSDGCEVSLLDREGSELDHLVIDNPKLYSRKRFTPKAGLLVPYGEKRPNESS